MTDGTSFFSRLPAPLCEKNVTRAYAENDFGRNGGDVGQFDERPILGMIRNDAILDNKITMKGQLCDNYAPVAHGFSLLDQHFRCSLMVAQLVGARIP